MHIEELLEYGRDKAKSKRESKLLGGRIHLLPISIPLGCKEWFHLMPKHKFRSEQSIYSAKACRIQPPLHHHVVW